jgi:hypothetical protein
MVGRRAHTRGSCAVANQKYHASTMRRASPVLPACCPPWSPRVAPCRPCVSPAPLYPREQHAGAARRYAAHPRCARGPSSRSGRRARLALLQHGCAVDTLRRALTRDSDGSASGPLAHALDLLG